MRRVGAVAIGLVVALALVGAVAAAQTAFPGVREEPIYEASKRATYISSALNAVRNTSVTELIELRDHIYFLNQSRCRSSIGGMAIQCLLKAAEERCAKKPTGARVTCQQISDILITNRRSENAFIPARERYKIQQENDDYKKAIRRELKRRYAALVADLGMSVEDLPTRGDLAKLGQEIDQHCLKLSAKRDLSWQHCTAAIVWFVGTSNRSLEIEEDDKGAS